MASLLAICLFAAFCPAEADQASFFGALDPVFPTGQLRLGAYAHDPMSPEKGSADINAELLLAKLNLFPGQVWDVLIPRAQLGGTFNFSGKTSFVYAGAAWTFDVYKNFFVEGSLGEALNNGDVGRNVPSDRNPVGCNWSFHETGSLGYRLNADWSVLATIEHYSNAGLCVRNRGVTNYGLRIGHSF
ncbi:MAG TPA: acyloxyacyl hydrolase [Rhodoblastus sp.]|nr:acyloxyacyl hydrolase [Rhodoblastus sp.]